MSRFFVGNRTALWGRTSAAVQWRTDGPGSNYNNALHSGYISVPSGGLQFINLDVGMGFTSAPDVFLRFDVNDPGFRSGGNPFVRFFDVNLVPLLQLSGEQLQRWNGSSWVNIQPFSFPTFSLVSLQCQITAGANGAFRLWNGNLLILEQTNIPMFSALNIRRAALSCPSFTNASTAFSGMAMAAFDMRGYQIASDSLANPGAFTDGTGALSNLGDGNLATVRTLPAPNNRFSGTTPARTLPGGVGIEAVSIVAIARAGVDAPNGRAILELGGTQYDTGANFSPALGPAFAWHGQTFTAHPTQGPWTEANYNAINKGLQARS